MAATDSLRKQHAEMAEVVKRIEALLDPQKAAASANEVRETATRFMNEMAGMKPTVDAFGRK